MNPFTNQDNLSLKIKKLEEKIQRKQIEYDEKVVDCKRDVTIQENILKILEEKKHELEEKRRTEGLSPTEYESSKLIEIQRSVAEKMRKKVLKRLNKALDKRDKELVKLQRKLDNLNLQLHQNFKDA